MLAALLCGVGLPTPHAREPLFASTVGAVQRESRGKNGGAAAEIKVLCGRSHALPTRCAWVEGKCDYAGHGWWGTLETLRAGRMYIVTSAVPRPGSVTYASEGQCI